MIRVGLIGAGFIGRNHFNQYEQMMDRVKVVTICDLEEDRRTGDWTKVGGNIADTQGTKRDLHGAKPCDDWQTVVNSAEVDLIDICLPTCLHREISVAALNAGKHVLCEKPMALNVEECDEMLAAAAQARGQFMIAQCIRFWREYVFVKKAIDDGRFGRLKALHLRRHTGVPSYAWRNWIVDPKLSGGAILDLHVHDVDYAVFALGKPSWVVAQGYNRQGGGVDRVHSIWHYNTDTIVQLEGAWDMPPGFTFNMGFTAVFERGAIDFNLKGDKPLAVYLPDGSIQTPAMEGPDGYYSEIAYFLDCIENHQPPTISTPSQSREAVAIALAEKRSIATGAPVAIE